MPTYSDIIAKEIHASGWTWRETPYIDTETGKHMVALDAHKPDRLRCIVRADDRQTAFMELRSIPAMQGGTKPHDACVCRVSCAGYVRGLPSNPGGITGRA